MRRSTFLSLLVSAAMVSGCAMPTANGEKLPPPVAPPTTAPQNPIVPDRPVSAKPVAGYPLTYPNSMLKQGIEGSAVAHCTVSVSGWTRDCRIASSTDPAFADAALAYVSRARYLPAIKDGVPVEDARDWTITFKVDRPNTPPDPAALARRPVFPPEMARQSITFGRVALDCVFTGEGRAKDCVVASSTNRGFEQSALDYAARTIFDVPLTPDGKHPDVRHRLFIDFSYP